MDLQSLMEEFDWEREWFDHEVLKIEQTALKVHEDSEFTAAHWREFEDNKAELDWLNFEV